MHAIIPAFPTYLHLPHTLALLFTHMCMNTCMYVAHVHTHIPFVYCCLATKVFVGLLQATGWVWLTVR